MSTNFDEVVQDVMTQTRREKRRRVGMIALTIILVAMAATMFINSMGDRARQEAIDDLKLLCENGTLDCTGSRGLPGPKSPAGASVTNVQCLTGKFVFTLSNDRTFRVGDCIAERGKQGLRGLRGKNGKDGRSIKGDRGPRGFPGHNGKDGARGPRGFTGPPVDVPSNPPGHPRLILIS